MVSPFCLQGVRIYGVQVNDNDRSTEFFRTMTEMADGQHLKMSQFDTLCDVIMAICYREKGAEFLSVSALCVCVWEGRGRRGGVRAYLKSI